MLKRFRKTLQDAAGSPTRGGNAITNQQANATEVPKQDEASGFICPMCMAGFKTPDLLQVHFDQAHSENLDSSLALQKNTSTTSKSQASGDVESEEKKSGLAVQSKSYHEEKTLVNEPLHAIAAPSKNSNQHSFPSADGDPGEMTRTKPGNTTQDGNSEDALKQEVSDLEASLQEEQWYSKELKSELDKKMSESEARSKELELVRQQMTISIKTNEDLAREKESVNQRLAEKFQECAKLQLQIDELKSDKSQHEKRAQNQSLELEKAAAWIRDLEAQLIERPGADDVLVLKKELVSVQTLMDQLTLDSEKQKEDAKMECKKLEEKNATLQDELKELKQMHEQAIMDRNSSEAVLVESLQKRENENSNLESARSAEIEKVKEELADIQSALENEETHSKNLERKNNDVQEKYLNEKAEKEKFEKALAAAKEELAKGKKEGEIQKVELEEKVKNEIELRKKLDEMQKRIGKTSSESDFCLKEKDAAIESLKQQYDDANAECDASRKEIEVLKSKTNTLQRDMDELKVAHKELELAKSLNDQKHQRSIEDLTGKLSQASSSDTELKKQIERLETDAKKAWDDSQEERSRSRMALLENENQITQLKGDKENLESEIQRYKHLLEEEEKKWRNCEASSSKLEEQIKILQDEKASTAQKVEALEKSLFEVTTKVENLSREKDAVLQDVKRLQQERNELTEKMEVGEGQAILVGQLKDENQSLLKRLEEGEIRFNEQAAQNESVTKNLENVLSESKARIKLLQQSMENATNNIKSLELVVTNLKEENSKHEQKLNEKDEEMRRLQDATSNQKLEFESKSSSLQRSLDEKTRSFEKLSSSFEILQASSEASLKKQDEAKENLQERLNKAQEETARMEIGMKEKEEKLVAKDTEIASLNTALDNLKEQHKKDVEVMKTKHQEKKAALEVQLSLLHEQHTDLKEQLSSANAKTSDAEMILAESAKRIKIFELDVEDKESKISNLKSELDSTKTQLNNVRSELQKTTTDFEAQIADLKEQHLKTVKDVRSEHRIACDNLKQNLETAKTVHQAEIASLKKIEEERENSIQLNIAEIAKLKGFVRTKEEMLITLQKNLSAEKSVLEKGLEESSGKISHLTSELENMKLEKTAVGKVLEGKEKEFRVITVKLSEMEEICKVKEKNFESLTADLNAKIELLKETEEKLGSANTKLADSEKYLQESEAKCKKHENNAEMLKASLKESETTVEELRNSLKDVNSKFQESKSALQMKEEKIKALEEYFAIKEKEMSTTTENLESEIDRVKSEILQEKGRLEEEVSLRKQKEEEWKNENKKIEEEARKKESQWSVEKEEMLQSQDMLKGAQQILISGKMELQKQLDSTKEEVENEKVKLSEAERSYKEKIGISNMKINSLTEELEVTKLTLKSTEDEKQKTETRLQLEVSTLRDNLDSVRAEWQQAVQQVEEKNAESDELKGQVVVLQATAQNNADERRALLERCILAEQSVEQLKGNEVQLKKRLDDAQAAMHELGRENQAMQVKHTTVLSRQWADDKEAIECTGCRKQFSITVRRHHCRHCGKIFCAECSSKTMTVASSKKPVRVCEKCYDDLLTVQ